MADYDLFSEFLPVLGTATGVAMDGAHYTPAIDTLGWRAFQAIANIASAVAYNTAGLGWSFQDSPDNVTFTAVDPSLVIFNLPLVQSNTSQVFHGSYIGKNRYVKAAFNAGGVFAATPASAWLVSTSATAIASATTGPAVQTGTYTISVDELSATPGTMVFGTNLITASSDTVAISNPGTATVLAPYFGRNFRFVCTIAGATGTLEGFDPNGNPLGPVIVGATGATLHDTLGNALFKIVVTDGTGHIQIGDEIEVRVTDLGVNRYKLLAPDGITFFYLFGKVPFVSSHLNFTIPDTTAPSSLSATTTIAVTTSAVTGQITAMMSHPLSGPVWQTAMEGLNQLQTWTAQ
jgi:hypothetical protein